MKFHINTLSAHAQFQTVVEATDAFTRFMSLLEYLKPAYSKRRCTVSWDAEIESRELVSGEPLSRSLNNMRRTPETRDAVAKWFQWSRNSFQCDETLIDEVHYSVTDEVSTSGTIGNSFQHCYALINFGGSTLTESRMATLRTPDRIHTISSVFDLSGLYLLTPRYEPSDKHRAEPYYARGEWVSAMPLNVEQAQEILLQGLTYNNDILSFRNTCGRYFRFKRTHIDRFIYHGFVVDEVDIPQSLRSDIRGNPD